MFKIFNLEGLFLSKLKKFVSVVLVVAMLMTVAPVSIFASAYAPAYTHGTAPSYTYSEYYVDTSATDPVIRVGNSSNPFQAGTSVVKTTESGIPDVGNAVFSASGYAGETPRFPTINVKFVGRKPSEIVEIKSTSATSQTASVSTTTGKVGEKLTVDGKDAPIHLVGGVMVGLQLTEGDHEIVFTYENKAFNLGLTVSLVCLVAFLGLIYWDHREVCNEKSRLILSKIPRKK